MILTMELCSDFECITGIKYYKLSAKLYGKNGNKPLHVKIRKFFTKFEYIKKEETKMVEGWTKEKGRELQKFVKFVIRFKQ